MDARVKEVVERSERIVFFGGAGVSTESNIPDFRSESGLYQAVSQYGKSPETMLSHSFFMNNMETFFDYYKNNLIYREAEPNKAHIALARLEEKGKLTAVVTQNIDGLHQKAGSKKFMSSTVLCCEITAWNAALSTIWTTLWTRRTAAAMSPNAKPAGVW